MRTVLKRFRIPLIIIGIALFIFFPQKLSHLLPLSEATDYDYLISGQDNYIRSTDVAALQSAMQDTYVVWAGWTRYFPGEEPLNRLDLYSSSAGTEQLLSVGDQEDRGTVLLS